MRGPHAQLRPQIVGALGLRPAFAAHGKSLQFCPKASVVPRRSYVTHLVEESFPSLARRADPDDPRFFIDETAFAGMRRASSHPVRWEPTVEQARVQPIEEAVEGVVHTRDSLAHGAVVPPV
jgi:hypothetical protein